MYYLNTDLINSQSDLLLNAALALRAHMVDNCGIIFSLFYLLLFIYYHYINDNKFLPTRGEALAQEEDAGVKLINSN